MTIFLFFLELLCVLKWVSLLSNKRRDLTATGHYPSTRGRSSGHSLTNWPVHTHTHTHTHMLATPLIALARTAQITPLPTVPLKSKSKSLRPKVSRPVCLGAADWPSVVTTITLTVISFKVKFMFRPTVSLPVCLRVKHSSGAQDQICTTVRQLRVYWCGASSVMRGGHR
jgi:hypothetical protein